jgi:hypothetical protein
MKIRPSRLIILALLIAWPFAGPAAGDSLELWVAPAGADDQPGTPGRPLASLPAALKLWQARQQDPKRTPADSLRVVLRGGFYPLPRTLVIEPNDFAAPNKPIGIEAAPGEQPVLSGGVEIRQWAQPSGTVPGLPEIACGKVWVARAPRFHGHFLEFRELWVTGAKATLAREPNGDELARLVAWDKVHRVATIPAAMLQGMPGTDRLEMVVDQVWEIAILRLKSARSLGTNALVTFQSPESDLEFKHPWPPVTVNAKYQAPFYLQNALAFLDSPGDWFEDLSAGKIYYWPRAGEDMTRATVIVPALETLVKIEGTRANPLTQVHFKGITFANTTWLRPSTQGHVPLQAGMFMLKAQKLSPRGTPYHAGLDNLAWIGRPPAAVGVQNANDISFENCAFEHLAAAGLDWQSGVRDSLVQGCQFRDIGGNGLQIGMFSDPTVETHIPYNPADARELCADDRIANNLITDCGTEDWGCVGIAAGYVRHLTIEHNEVSHLPYTGISLGWGWTKSTNALRDNVIVGNHVHDVGRRLGDLGGIYTLSAQPGTVVSDNAIEEMPPSPYVPDPQHWFYLYADEGSSGITFRDNWCPAAKFLKNANGPGNLWSNNGPGVAEKIKNAAGLEPAFQYLLK